MPKKYRLSPLQFILIFATAFFLHSCKSSKTKSASSNNVNVQDFINKDDIFNDIDKAKKIFYSLPSPLETAMLIKSAGATYDPELLNSLDNIPKYTTSKSMALNLGIYTTDLSFSSLFDQTQTAINYMNAAKKMADGLDISDAINDDTMKRLEDNLQNRDVVMDIISETFLNSSAYLKENERQDVAAIVLVGGWIEGLYIATELVGNKSIKGNKLVNRILEQKLSFNIVERLLDDNKSKDNGEPNKDIKELMVQLQPLKLAFDKVTVKTTQTQAVADTTTKVTTLKAKTTVSVQPKDFKVLQEEVKKLRTSFIQ